MTSDATLRLGFGASGPLGQRWFSEEKTRALVAAALEGGVRHFDTAPFYFSAQQRLGRALSASKAADIFVSTKTGTRRAGRTLVKDFSARAIRSDVDLSLRQLGRDRLDLLYLHGPNEAQIAETRPVLDALLKEGLVGMIGVCGDGAALTRAVADGFGAVMGVYNVIDRRNRAAFAAAREKGVLTVAVAPLAQGLFDPRFARPGSPSDLWRLARAAFRGRYDRRAIVAARAALGAEDPAAAALAFVLAEPAIDVVMTTTTKRRHLEASIRTAAGAIDAELLARLTGLSLDPAAGGH